MGRTLYFPSSGCLLWCCWARAPISRPHAGQENGKMLDGATPISCSPPGAVDLLSLFANRSSTAIEMLLLILLSFCCLAVELYPYASMTTWKTRNPFGLISAIVHVGAPYALSASLFSAWTTVIFVSLVSISSRSTYVSGSIATEIFLSFFPFIQILVHCVSTNSLIGFLPISPSSSCAELSEPPSLSLLKGY